MYVVLCLLLSTRHISSIQDRGVQRLSVVFRYVVVVVVVAIVVHVIHTHMSKTNTGLGTFLTIAYYALDHYNPESIKRRKYWTRHGYPYCGLNGHLVHFGALPRFCTWFPYDPDLPLMIFGTLPCTWHFVCFGVYNRLATGKWQYLWTCSVQLDSWVVCFSFSFRVVASITLLFSTLTHSPHTVVDCGGIRLKAQGHSQKAGMSTFSRSFVLILLFIIHNKFNLTH